jgi:hypothetical protein
VKSYTVLRGCLTKRAITSEKLALELADKLNRRNKLVGHEIKRPYLCPTCNFYHIGTSRGSGIPTKPNFNMDKVDNQDYKFFIMALNKTGIKKLK